MVAEVVFEEVEWGEEEEGAGGSVRIHCAIMLFALPRSLPRLIHSFETC